MLFILLLRVTPIAWSCSAVGARTQWMAAAVVSSVGVSLVSAESQHRQRQLQHRRQPDGLGLANVFGTDDSMATAGAPWDGVLADEAFVGMALPSKSGVPDLRHHHTVVLADKTSLAASRDSTSQSRAPLGVVHFAEVPSQMAVPLRTNSDVAISVAKPATVAEYDTPLSMSSEKVDDHSSTEGSRRLLLGAVKRTSAATATQRRGSVVLARAAGRIQTRFRDSMEHMGTQCMKFASLLKTHNVRGAELARLWRGTCSPTTTFPSPVSNVGVGSAQYARLCNAISAAVAPFVGSTAAPLDWNPTDVCAAVLRSFKDSGVGSSPVIG
eukprot:TRINITY_DN7689_c0_g1_i1.p1 TRINITY_DN7689_c0_g1~~TRINITY_DN7689_c0_g1_i1.p1  ORF type:complete len:326 (-),score=40.73 TRINITY_DN7689_c0_g1_i1:70-1047(-)